MIATGGKEGDFSWYPAPIFFFSMDALPDAEERGVRKDGLVTAWRRRGGGRGTGRGVVGAGAVLPPLLVADGVDVVLEGPGPAIVERVEHGRGADDAVGERVDAVGRVAHRHRSRVVAPALGEAVEDSTREDVPRVRVRLL